MYFDIMRKILCYPEVTVQKTKTKNTPHLMAFLDFHTYDLIFYTYFMFKLTIFCSIFVQYEE